MMIIKMNLSKEQVELFKTMAYIIDGNNDYEQYYFLPYWFKSTENNGEYELYHLDNPLPNDLKEVITEMSENKNNNQ